MVSDTKESQCDPEYELVSATVAFLLITVVTEASFSLTEYSFQGLSNACP